MENTFLLDLATRSTKSIHKWRRSRGDLLGERSSSPLFTATIGKRGGRKGVVWWVGPATSPAWPLPLQHPTAKVPSGMVKQATVEARVSSHLSTSADHDNADTLTSTLPPQPEAVGSGTLPPGTTTVGKRSDPKKSKQGQIMLNFAKRVKTVILSRWRSYDHAGG